MSIEPKTQREIVLQTGGDYLVPAAGLEQILATYQLKKDFIEQVLRDGVDYGTTPGTNEKPSLKKAGAEKMATFFGLAPVFEDVEIIEDWTGAEHGGEPFFYYRQKCKLYRGERLVGSADGSCNSWEKKYRYRWVNEFEIPVGVDKATLRTQGGRTSEFKFAIDKAETVGQFGKPAEYWKCWRDAIASGTARPIKRKAKNGRELDAYEMDSTVYAVKNLDAAEQTNTILKMAQKRALVAAVLIVTNASDYFTQDLEDLGDFVTGEIVDTNARTVSRERTVAGNIDPVSDELWHWYLALANRAEKVSVSYSMPHRDKIAAVDLKADGDDLVKRVETAEADAKATAAGAPAVSAKTADAGAESDELGANPDPVPDSMWQSWQDLCKRADAAGVEHGNPDRARITRAELSEIYNGLLRQVKATTARR